MTDEAGGAVEVWTNGWDGKIYNNVKDLDATAYSGTAKLAGNDMDNVIKASSGDSSLWGGFGGNDTLIGGAGKNEFFYGLGGGYDIIENANDGDLVNLFDIELEDIVGTKVENSSTTINFRDGGTLKLNNSADVTFKLADGSKIKNI